MYWNSCAWHCSSSRGSEHYRLHVFFHTDHRSSDGATPLHASMRCSVGLHACVSLSPSVCTRLESMKQHYTLQGSRIAKKITRHVMMELDASQAARHFYHALWLSEIASDIERASRNKLESCCMRRFLVLPGHSQYCRKFI